jgi:hypothetical protein
VERAGLLGLEIPDSAPKCEERRCLPAGFIRWVQCRIGITRKRLDMALDPFEHDGFPVRGCHVPTRLSAPLNGCVATRFHVFLLVGHWIWHSRTNATIALVAGRDCDRRHIVGADAERGGNRNAGAESR